ncbi:Oidioi.mRNA.OKI2018_I69.XSR.g13377.t1.cds [Oikopleura dioica]|uniref:Oidioi.mRNA.OKI2018_I69.XSR.g13377.t1.cds n=1 Tax=Oikopleura dioica TaxID=34765 RepID=A0ABN7SDL7_OIKDI|nr:Oidioi.mRNA.OKI2018_I69.XSR.g13377.t1.cds [Oikopleura dioica]
MNDGMEDKVASPDSEDCRTSIKEGFFYHEKVPNGRFDKLTRTFLKTEVERLLVLRMSDGHEVANRSESVPILEIYESDARWQNERIRVQQAKGQPWCKDRFLIEDIYYIYKYDVDRLNERKSNSLYFQLIIFLKGETLKNKSDNHTGVRKIELWFKNDDAAKRDDWIHEIYKIRTQIQEDAKTKDILDNNIPTTFFNFSDPSDPLAAKKKTDSSQLYPEVQYSYLEVNFGNLPKLKESTIRDMKRVAEAQMKKNIKLIAGEHYHLKYKVSTGKHEKFSDLRETATKYSIEFVNPKDSQIIYAIGNNDLSKIGKFPCNPKDPESRVVAIEILAKPTSQMEAKLKKIPGYLTYLKTNPRCTHFTSQIILRFTREIDKKGFFDKYLTLKDQNTNASQNMVRTSHRRWTGPPKPNKIAQKELLEKEDSGGARKRTESAGPEKVRPEGSEIELNDIPAQRSDPSSLPISVDIHGQPSTSSNYSNIHLQRQAQLAQAEADENEEERPLALIGSPLALRNKSSKHSNKQRSEELLPMETTTTVEYIAETAFNSSPIAEQAVRQSKVARTSSSSAIPIPFSGSIVQGTVETDSIRKDVSVPKVDSQAPSSSSFIRNG